MWVIKLKHNANVLVQVITSIFVLPANISLFLPMFSSFQWNSLFYLKWSVLHISKGQKEGFVRNRHYFFKIPCKYIWKMREGKISQLFWKDQYKSYNLFVCLFICFSPETIWQIQHIFTIQYTHIWTVVMSLYDIVGIFLQLKFVFYVNPVADVCRVVKLISCSVTQFKFKYVQRPPCWCKAGKILDSIYWTFIFVELHG